MSDATDVIASIEAAIERATDTLHNARLWESEGTYNHYIAPALSQARDHIDTLTRERDAERAVIEAAKALRDSATKRQWAVANDRLEDAVDALHALEGDA
jgi:flavin-binding protein dodecin